MRQLLLLLLPLEGAVRSIEATRLLLVVGDAREIKSEDRGVAATLLALVLRVRAGRLSFELEVLSVDQLRGRRSSCILHLAIQRVVLILVFEQLCSGWVLAQERAVLVHLVER